MGIALSRIRMSPEQQKEYERGEHDERNAAIRENAITQVSVKQAVRLRGRTMMLPTAAAKTGGL